MDNNSEYLRRIKLFIASPNDVINEREKFRKVIDRVNRIKAETNGFYFKAVGWEDTLPGKGRPQEKINEDINKSDIIVMLLWKRWGTPTGKYSSGFEEEFEIAKKQGKDIWFYFREISDGTSDNRNDQIEKVLKFRNKIESEKEYLFKPYIDENDWTEQFFDHLCFWLDDQILENVHSLSNTDVSTINTEGINDNMEINPVITKTPSIQSRIYDGMRLPPIGSTQLSSYMWDVNNFDGFWYDLDEGISSETLEIGGLFSPLEVEINNNNNTIPENVLVYQTTRQNKTLKIVESGIISNNILNSFPNGQYNILGWQGELYIALKGDAKKLVKLILEQGSTEEKILTIGEIWDLGDGWTLAVQSIDAKASPRQAWLILIKDGVKLVDEVVSQNNVFIYRGDIAGKSDAPLFVTYVDSIFAGATTDIVKLKYTWAVSTSVIEIMAGDTFGQMEVTTASASYLTLKNKDKEIKLGSDSTTEIMGNLKFRVADDKNFLRFYPTIEKYHQ